LYLIGDGFVRACITWIATCEMLGVMAAFMGCTITRACDIPASANLSNTAFIRVEIKP
jgi:hypothetical protein